MTAAQLRILSVLREQEKVYRKHAESPSYTDGEAEKAFKEYADECIVAVGILRNAYDSD